MTDEIEMKQGLVYQADRTNQLRYADKDGKEQWIQQISRYKALEPIKRGQAVSIATKEDFERLDKPAELQSTETYVVLTDTRRHNRCIGLALEPSDIGKEIHIQSFGKFEFDKSYEEMHDGLEYNPEFTFDEVGKTVYIAYPGPRFEGDTELGAGCLTTDTDKVYKYYHNIIQIGHLTDAPNSPEEKITDIEISIQGDDRGLLDATMFEGEMGEDVEINPLNPIRVFAFGEDENTKFQYSLKYAPLRDKDWAPSNQDFIFIHDMGGNGAFISFTDDFDPNHILDEEDHTVVSSKHLYTSDWNGRQIYKANISDSDFADPAKLDRDIFTLGSVIKRAWEELSGVDASFQCNNTTIVENKIAQGDTSYVVDERIATITASDYSGFYDVYISKSLRLRLDSVVVKHGSIDNRGKIVLADIRIPTRRNVFGIYTGNENKLLKGHTYVFVRQGEITVPETSKFDFKVGDDYYLDMFGTLRNKPLTKYGVAAKIGTIKQKNKYFKFVADIKGCEKLYRGDFPVGYQKPCPFEYKNEKLNYIAEFGYFACDGEQTALKEEYPVLYNRLLGWYPQNEIDCDDGVSFKIPRIVRETPVEIEGSETQLLIEVPVEIKATEDSMFEELSHVAFIRDFQKFDEETETSAEILTPAEVTIKIEAQKIDVAVENSVITHKIARNAIVKVICPELNASYLQLYTVKNGQYEYGNWYIDKSNFLAIDLEDITYTEYQNGTYKIDKPTLFVRFIAENGTSEEKAIQLSQIFKTTYQGAQVQFSQTFTFKDAISAPNEDPESEVTASIKPFDISEIADYGFKDEESIGLDNFDIHLYVDPNKNYESGAHNWVEIHEGFFKFNEANTFGFNWKLDYIEPNPVSAPYGKWVLSSDIGEGHGIAYTEGNSSAPLKLTDCYYKLYVARKEKIPRQFDISNIYKRYLTNTIYSDADETIPFVTKAVTGKAVQLARRNQKDIDSIEVNEGATIQFGNKELKVSKFEVGSTGTIRIYADDDVMFETEISEIGINEIRKFIDDYLREHHHTRTIDGISWEDNYKEADDDKGRIHGFVTGKGGTVNASALEHLQAANLKGWDLFESENEEDYEDHPADSFKSSWRIKEEKAYIPVRSVDDEGVMTEYHEGRDKYYEDNELIETKVATKYGNVVEDITKPNLPESKQAQDRVYKDKVTVGNKSLEVRFNFDVDEEDNSAETEGNCTDIDFIKTLDGEESYARLKIGSYTIASLSKLKRIYGENLPDTPFTTELAENSIKYTEDTDAFKTVLGSALQAAYEMPIAYWQYNNEKEWYHKTVSVVVERIRDVISNIDNVQRNVHSLSENTSDYVDNSYNYTPEEAASIKEYLTSTLDTGNKGVNQTSQVGLLLKAAKETQERLLKLESSTFGADAETIPGDKKPTIETGVPQVNSDPTTLGLNRLVRAICLELFCDANPDNPAATDFDGDKPRQAFNLDRSTEDPSALSRLDEFDRLFHGRVEDKEENGSIVAHNRFKEISSKTYPYEIPNLPSNNLNQDVTPLNVITKESIAGNKHLDAGKSNFNGTIDALYRITKKVNALTKCISGSDNILNGPVELNKIRDRLSDVEISDTNALLRFSWRADPTRMYSIIPQNEDND